MEQKVNSEIQRRKLLDKRRNPPEYMDEVLPTQTVHIFSRKKQGTLLDSASGATVMGSIQFTGSFHEDAPGSYSLRVMRRNFNIGSVSPYSNANIEWSLRHSRLGTVDEIGVFIGTRVSTLNTSNRKHELIGGPMNPVYSFGPGTLWNIVTVRQGTARIYTSLEGIF